MFNSIIPQLVRFFIVTSLVSLLVFLLIHMIPGDPVEVMLGESAQPADMLALRHHLGLDKPLLEQMGSYFFKLFHGDLGQSLHQQRPVADIIAERLPATLYLTSVALIIALMIAIPAGIMSAYNKGRYSDTATMMLSLAAVSIPNFWLGPMLILVFSIWLAWTPVGGNESLQAIWLPAITLGSGLAAILTRMVRSTMLEVMHEDYIRTAKAKGQSIFAILWHHAMANAWLPILTIVGMQLGALLAGSVITETIFSWPGLGSLMIESIQKRDYPVVQGCILLISLFYVSVNMLTDILYAVIDPRVVHRA